MRDISVITTNSEANKARLNAVREAYWNGCLDTKLYELEVLEYRLRMTLDIEEPTEDQQKILFFMLPAQIIGLGIAWGFDDEEVSDDIRDFVAKNVGTIRTALAL